MSKKRNPFEASQDKKVEERGALIAEYLKISSSSRFDNLTALADACAKYVSTAESKPGVKVCHGSTFLRSGSRYKKLLVEHLKKSMTGTSRVSRKSVKDPTANVLLADADLDLGNLEREVKLLRDRNVQLQGDNDRLKAYIASLPHATSGPGVVLPALPGSQPTVSEDRDRYLKTCEVLADVLASDAADGLLEFDPLQGSIVDRTSMPPRVISSGRQLEPFSKWHKGQAGTKK